MQLNLFIYDTDGAISPKIPILVFFHGGDTTHGSASDLNLYDPSTFVAISNLIVITVNYRLGVFGFLKLDPLFPGNQALYDQSEALRWIHRNAAAMGGDPDKITLSGHGSGATLASFHLFIKQSLSLFRNIILQSGTPLVSSLAPIAAAEANSRAKMLLEQIGCASSGTAECVQNSSAVAGASMALLGVFARSDYVTQTYLKTFFPPSIDGTLILVTPEESLATGHFKQCSVLTGFVAHEGMVYALVMLTSGCLNKSSTFFLYRMVTSFFREQFFTEVYIPCKGYITCIGYISFIWYITCIRYILCIRVYIMYKSIYHF